MKKTLAILALSVLAFTQAHATLSLVVSGPESIRPGESFTLNFTINWDGSDFTPDQGFTGFEYMLYQFPTSFGNEIWFESSSVVNHIGSDYEFFAAYGGRLGTGETGFSLAQSNFDNAGTVVPPLFAASVTFTTTESLAYGNYRFTTNLDKTFVYYGQEYNIRAFDHVQDFYLTVGPGIPEPSTYAAGIGIVALIATAVIRRRNKRSSAIAYFESYRDAA